MDDLKIIVLAAGQGKRMNSAKPKVLVPFRGRPMVSYVLQAVSKSGVCLKPLVVVVGQQAEEVQQVLGDAYDYVLQTEQLGTGHAVKSARAKLAGQFKHIMVLYGDHPTITAGMIADLYATHLEGNAVITMATVEVPDFADWRAGFFDFGRVLRRPNGQIEHIIEKKDATEQEKAVTELNPSYFCFQADWLWDHLDALNNTNAQKEFYLTDLVGLAVSENLSINSLAIRPEEALGVNTPEQLTFLEQLISNELSLARGEKL